MNPLDQLQDIHLPEQVSAWPPAYGWWLLAVLSLSLLFLMFIIIRNHRRHHRARKAAINELKQIQHSDETWHSDINALLKRVCVSYFPAEHVARLHGKDWIAFLAAKLPQKSQAEFEQVMTPWQSQLYRSNDVNQAEQSSAFESVQAQSLVWLKRFNSKAEQETKHV